MDLLLGKQLTPWLTSNNLTSHDLTKNADGNGRIIIRKTGDGEHKG